jgi:tetratricopeptide (TPR) repeat protein
VDANDELRAARRAHPSSRYPGEPLSRAELAELVAADIYRRTGREAPIDSHYVAKLERGVIRWPGRQYRAALRAVLGASTDSELGFRPPRRAEATPAPPALAAAASNGDADAFDRLAAVVERPRRADRAVVEHLAAVLARQRVLEDQVGARSVLPAVLAEIELIDDLAGQARGPVRAALIGLAGEYRQFLGWIGEDSGDPAAALAHYDRAMEAAQESGDANMITSVLSLKSHLAWSQRDAGRAIGLAEAGARDTERVSPGVLALITQQQARGHALDGHADAVDRLMDHTEALTARAAERPENEPPWTYFHGPDRVLFQRGVAYLELGRHADAVELFTAARAALPAEYRRDHGRYAANIALAAALDGQLDRATSLAREALTITMETGSAHTLAELRRARRAMDKWPDAPQVAEFDAALHARSGTELARSER